MNPSLIRVLSLWLSSSFWLNYPHTEIKVAVFFCCWYQYVLIIIRESKLFKSISEQSQILSLKPTLTEQDEANDFGDLRTIWWNILWIMDYYYYRWIHGFKTMYLTDFGEIFFILVQPWSWPWDFGVNVYTIFSLRVSKTWVKAQSTATESYYHVCRLFNRVGRINVGGVRSYKPQLSLGSISYFILWER